MKLNDYSLALLPQEAIDMLQDIQSVINNGKFQWPVVSSVPNWTGRAGEQVLYISGVTTRLYVCTSDQSSTNWLVLVGT